MLLKRLVCDLDRFLQRRWDYGALELVHRRTIETVVRVGLILIDCRIGRHVSGIHVGCVVRFLTLSWDHVAAMEPERFLACGILLELASSTFVPIAGLFGGVLRLEEGKILAGEFLLRRLWGQKLDGAR